MGEQVKEMTNAKDGLLKKAFSTAEQIAGAGIEVERLKTRASHLIEDGITDAKRMVKRGRYAAEDLVEETAHLIKRDPWQSVAITFGAGFGIGVVASWLLMRRTKNTEH